MGVQTFALKASGRQTIKLLEEGTIHFLPEVGSLCRVVVGGIVIRRSVGLFMKTDGSERSDIIDNHSVPKGFACRYEARVVLTLLLVELVISKGFEVERSRVIKGMICYGSFFSLCGCANEAAFEVGNLRKPSNLLLKGCTIIVGKILP